MTERLFTTYQVAELLDSPPGVVVQWMQKGQLEYIRLPDGPVRVGEKALVTFLRERGVDLDQLMAKVAEPPIASSGQADHEPDQSSDAPRRQDRAEVHPRGLPDWALLEELDPDPSGMRPAAALGSLASVYQADEALDHVQSQPEDGPGDTSDDELLNLALAHIDQMTGQGDDAPQIAHEACRPAHGSPMEPDQARASLPQNDHDQPGDGKPEEDQSVEAGPIEPAAVTAEPAEAFDFDTPSGRQLTEMLDQSCGLVLLAGLPAGGLDTLISAAADRLVGQGRSVAGVGSADFALALNPARRIIASPPWESTGHPSVATGIGLAGDLDSDVIIIEELTSFDAVRQALELAQAGRLVAAGVRARSATGAISLLLEVDPPRWPLAWSLLGAAAVRSVRRLCEYCKQPATIEPDQLPQPCDGAGDDCELFSSVGCDACGQCGYDGRILLLDNLVVKEDAAGLIRAGAGVAQLAALDRDDSFAREATALACSGLTSPAELARLLRSR